MSCDNDYKMIYNILQWFLMNYLDVSPTFQVPMSRQLPGPVMSGDVQSALEAPRAPLLGTVLRSTTGSVASTEGSEAVASTKGRRCHVEALWPSVQYHYIWLYITIYITIEYYWSLLFMSGSFGSSFEMGSDGTMSFHLPSSWYLVSAGLRSSGWSQVTAGQPPSKSRSTPGNDIEANWTAPQGEKVWWESRADPAMLGYIMTYHDISESNCATGGGRDTPDVFCEQLQSIARQIKSFVSQQATFRSQDMSPAVSYKREDHGERLQMQRPEMYLVLARLNEISYSTLSTPGPSTVIQWQWSKSGKVCQPNTMEINGV